MSALTWRHVKPRLWAALPAEEQACLEQDIWHYARMANPVEVDEAIAKFRDYIQAQHQAVAQDFGIAFAFTVPEDNLEKKWLATNLQN